MENIIKTLFKNREGERTVGLGKSVSIKWYTSLR